MIPVSLRNRGSSAFLSTLATFAKQQHLLSCFRSFRLQYTHSLTCIIPLPAVMPAGRPNGPNQYLITHQSSLPKATSRSEQRTPHAAGARGPDAIIAARGQRDRAARLHSGCSRRHTAETNSRQTAAISSERLPAPNDAEKAPLKSTTVGKSLSAPPADWRALCEADPKKTDRWQTAGGVT